MTTTANLITLWFWPWEAARAGRQMLETAAATQSVLGARLPMISEAFADPLGADHAELSLMVSEKAQAFGGSQETLTGAGRSVRRAARANAASIEKLTTGAIPSPWDWMAMFERNVSLAAELMTLPMRTMAPVHKSVTANARRLRKR